MDTLLFRRNYSNIDKLSYLLKMSHANIKSYYSEDMNDMTNSDGISKNGSIIKLENSLYCIANLNDLLLPSLNKNNINYKNIKLIDHVSTSNLNIDKNYDGESLIDILYYKCLRCDKNYIIISSFDSINIFDINIDNILKNIYTYKFNFEDLNRKIEIYDEYLYTIAPSTGEFTIIPLYDISNDFIGQDIIRLTVIDEFGSNSYANGTGFKIDELRKIIYIYNVNDTSNIYIYSLEKPYNPKFINSYTLNENVLNITFLKLSDDFLNSIEYYSENNVKNNHLIFITTQSCHHIINSTNLINIEYLGKNKNDRDIIDLSNIIYIENNLFLSYNNTNSCIIFLELATDNNETESDSECDHDENNNQLILKWVKSIKLDEFSTISNIKYFDKNLFILNNTKGLLTYKINKNDDNILLENIIEVDSFRYYKNSKFEGAKNIIKFNDVYYLLDSYNGITIFTDGVETNYSELSFLNNNTNNINYTKLPLKIFIHMELLSNIDNTKPDIIDFETKILAIDRNLKIVLLYVPFYILDLVKPFNIDINNNYENTIKNLSYGIDLNTLDSKKSLINVNITSDNYNIYHPIYKSNIVHSYNNSMYGNNINTGNIDFSGSLIINEYGNLVSFINFGSKNTLDISVLANIYTEYSKYITINFTEFILFKSFGSYEQDTFIIENFDNSNNNRIIYFIANNRHVFIVRKNLIPNIKINIIYKAIDFNNNLLGFTNVISINELKNSNIPAEYLNNDYLYFNAFYKDELSLLNGIYDEIYDNIDVGNIYFLEEPLQFDNILSINHNLSKFIFKSTKLDIDILNIEYLNSNDINRIINVYNWNNKFSVNHFLDYKNRVGKGFLVVNLTNIFYKINTDKLICGDIIVSINNSSNISSALMYKDIVNLDYYRFINNTWTIHRTELNSTILNSDFNNLII